MARQDSAEILAIKALSWLLGQDELMQQFLSATGFDPSGLAEVAGDPVFLAGILDFLLEDDRRVIGFCDACGLAYDQPGQARAGLPGGAQPNWT